MTALANDIKHIWKLSKWDESKNVQTNFKYVRRKVS